MSLGEYIRDRRVTMGLTRAGLARRCACMDPRVPGFGPGVGKTTLKLWEDERGRRLPSSPQLDVLCDALELSAAERAAMLRLCRARLVRHMVDTDLAANEG